MFHSNSFDDRYLCFEKSKSHTLAQVIRMANQKNYKSYGFKQSRGRKFVMKWYYHDFSSTGSFQDARKGLCGRKRRLTSEESKEIIQFMEDHNTSYRTTASIFDQSLSTTWRSCAKTSTNPEGIFCYKIQQSDDLTDREMKLRLNFCNEFIGHDWENTIFLDETNIELYHKPNPQNERDRLKPKNAKRRRKYLKKVGNPHFGVLLGIHLKSKMKIIILANRKKKLKQLNKEISVFSPQNG